jgi:hypothetical protein
VANKRTFAVVLVLVTLAVCAEAQVARVSLDCGSASIWLGMPKNQAIKALSDSGYVALEQMFHGVSIFFNSNEKKSCELSFALERVIYACREWTDTANGFDGALNAVIGALQSMTQGKFTQGCTVLPYHASTPDGANESADVACGKRSVTITKMSLPQAVTKTPTAQVVYTVREAIGTHP